MAKQLKRPWKDCYAYKRILEILDDYWLTEPDEAVVCVKMMFRHPTQGHQIKEIWWRNPNYMHVDDKERDFKDIDDYPEWEVFDITADPKPLAPELIEFLKGKYIKKQEE